MPRTLDPAAHAVRRDTFVDAAQRLITVKGYEEMSIQDVLAATGASKGAFYHYFDSKAALLDAVVERMVEQASVVVAPILEDPALPALDKLRTLFSSMARWKWERSDLVLQLLKVWTADENAIVREKFRRRAGAWMTPIFGAIVAQGVEEGIFQAAASPEHTARIRRDPPPGRRRDRHGPVPGLPRRHGHLRRGGGDPPRLPRGLRAPAGSARRRLPLHRPRDPARVVRLTTHPSESSA